MGQMSFYRKNTEKTVVILVYFIDAKEKLPLWQNGLILDNLGC